ncbi:hypothetical protein CDL12_14091 [Handroanthus impetiginosus]|uniref:Transcription factor, Myb superfamily n=1 Tax=Handroanthus impetiginosus TaxID=429701 RepID=A0A2G9H6Z7_9LAMI|nr:hypothetical protein CDL12_14091 [Handroanthus impetiginosus]
MGRSPCCDKVGLKKGPWTPEEDQKLLTYIQEHGHGSWRALPPKAGLQRCGKSCRLRWTNYLRPDIKRGKFSLQEEQTIIQLHALLGNRWSAIASHLPKRTDNEIKNYWNTHLKKRLMKMGIDPMTHKPKNHALGSGQPKDTANLSHMAQWESARLEAEARIVRENKLASSSIYSKLLKATTTARPPQPRPPCLDILKVWQGAWTKPRKDTTTKTVNGFFATKGNLESPTSILNFSENMVPTPNVGLIQENSLVRDISYLGNPIGKNNDDQVKGTMENSVQFHDIIDPTSFITYAADSLGVPSFLEGYTDFAPNTSSASAATGPADDVFEDNKISYWSNILNVVNSPIDSTVF